MPYAAESEDSRSKAPYLLQSTFFSNMSATSLTMLLLVTKKALLAKTTRFSSELLPFTSLGGRVSSLSLPLREVLTQGCSKRLSRREFNVGKPFNGNQVYIGNLLKIVLPNRSPMQMTLQLVSNLRVGKFLDWGAV